MSERLVAAKSALQRKIEGGLLIVLPPVLGCGLWYWPGPSPMNILVVILVFLLVMPLGQLIANNGSGERITRDERMRRLLERAVRRPFIVVVGWTWFAYGSLMLSATYAAIPAADIVKSVRWAVPSMLVIALAGAAICAFQVRLMYRKYDPSRAPAEPYRSVGQWIAQFIPIQFVCMGLGLAGGFFAARQVDGKFAFAVLLIGWLLGIGLETVAADLLLRRKPLLWHQMGFWGALAVAMLRMGVMIGALLGLNALINPVDVGAGAKADLANVIVAGAMAVIGFVAGTILMMLMWAFSRLGDLRSRRSP